MKCVIKLSFVCVAVLAGVFLPAQVYASDAAYTGKRVLYLSPDGARDRSFKARTYEVSPSSLADELLGYLKRIDGSEWSLSEAEYENDGILLALCDSPLVSAEDKKKLGGMNKEGYMIVADERGIRLVGNSVLALQHAMFDLLERLGCRFLTPSEAWTIIPEKTGLNLAMGKVFKQPDFISRRAFFSTGHGGDRGDAVLKDVQAKCIQWDRATRMGEYSHLSRAGHIWWSIIRAHEAEFRAHPEYFRMKEDGTRETFWDDPNKNRRYNASCFCPSSPGLKALCAKDRIAWLKRLREKDPTARAVSMDPNDGSRPCLCEKCKALGNASDQALDLVNHVAREIRKVYPDAMVGFTIYPPNNLPPQKVKIEPNVTTSLALGFNNTGMSLDQLARGWVDAGTRNLGVYPYLGYVQGTLGMPDLWRITFKYVSEQFPYIKKHWNANFMVQETSSTWGRMGPAMYLGRKLLWDVDADAEAIYNDYFKQAFGRGAKAMRALFDIWEERSGSRLTETNIARWLQQMNRAADATENESPAVKRRIEDMMVYLHFVVLNHAAEEALASGDLPRIEAATKEVLTFNWRVRNRQVIHAWGFMAQRQNETFNKVFKKDWWRSDNQEYKHWRYSHKQTAIWQQNTRDCTAAEARELFKRDLEAFSAIAAGNKRFSKDLVPFFEGAAEVHVPGGIHGVKKDGLYGPREPSVWYVYVERATNLRVTFNTSRRRETEIALPGNIRGATLTDAGDNVLFSHQTPLYQRGTLSEIEVRLPRAGVYRLALDSARSTRTYRPIFEPRVKHVYEQSAERSTYIQYFAPGYFYVPKGTKAVRLNYSGNLQIKAPSWAKAKHYGADTPGLLVIPVGADDGRVWEIPYPIASRFELLNVPPYVAPTKANMLVPEEVLEKDGRPEASNQ